MCLGVRFSLHLASWLSDFDHFFFLCVWFLAPLFFPRKWGGGQGPLGPPPWIRACNMPNKIRWHPSHRKRNDNKRPIGLIAPPFKIYFLATENWAKMKLKLVCILQKIIHLASGCHIWSFFAQNHMLTKSKSRSIASQITNLASRKSYLVIILPNSYQKLTKSKIR